MRALAVVWLLLTLTVCAGAQPIPPPRSAAFPSEETVEAPKVDSDQRTDDSTDKEKPGQPDLDPAEHAIPTQTHPVSGLRNSQTEGKNRRSEEDGTEYWSTIFGVRLKITDTLTGFFTLALVIYTRALNRSTIKLWEAGEEQRKVTERIASDQARDMRDTIAIGRDSAAAAKDSARIAKEALVASSRAWLKVAVEAGTQPLIFSEGQAEFSVSVSFDNIGNAPARNIGTRAWLCIWRTEPGKDPFSEHDRHCEHAIGHHYQMDLTLYPGESYPAAAGLVRSTEVVRLNADELAAGLKVADGSVQLYIGGCVWYTSPSDPARYHATRYLFTLDRADRQGINPEDSEVPSELLRLSLPHMGHGNRAD